MGKIEIEEWNEAEDGKLCQQNMEKKLKRQNYNFMTYTFSRGTNFPDHTHSISKKDAIISGRFEFTMYGETVELKPGDMVKVPKGTVHNARVLGNDSVTFYDATQDL